MDFQGIVKHLKQFKVPHTTEDEMQRAIAQILSQSGISFEREFRLSGKDRVDFLIEGGIAIECKIKGQAMRIHRQIERYMKHDAVTSLILFTSYHMGVFDEINGKPAVVIKPGVAWL